MYEITYSPLPYFIINSQFTILKKSLSCQEQFKATHQFLDLVDEESVEKFKNSFKNIPEFEIVMKTNYSDYSLMKVFVSMQAEEIHLQLLPQDQLVKKLNAEVRKHRKRLLETDIELLESKNKLENAILEIQRLSSPVIQLAHHIALVPLFGNLTKDLIETNKGTLLQDLAQRNIHYALIDFTGIHKIEWEIASIFPELLHSLRLLGIEVALIGLKPDHARTLYSYEMADWKTFHNLQKAITYYL